MLAPDAPDAPDPGPSRRPEMRHGSPPASPGEPAVTKFKNPDTAALVRRRLSKNSDDVDALFVLAAIRVRGGKVAEGITILNQVLRIDPKYPGAWRFKATLHRMQGEDDAERSAQRKADEVEP